MHADHAVERTRGTRDLSGVLKLGAPASGDRPYGVDGTRRCGVKRGEESSGDGRDALSLCLLPLSTATSMAIERKSRVGSCCQREEALTGMSDTDDNPDPGPDEAQAPPREAEEPPSAESQSPPPPLGPPTGSRSAAQVAPQKWWQRFTSFTKRQR
jgi:hypothetical protein